MIELPLCLVQYLAFPCLKWGLWLQKRMVGTECVSALPRSPLACVLQRAEPYTMAEWARSTVRSSCLPVVPHLRVHADWISVIWGDKEKRSACCFQRCAQEVLEQTKGRGVYKYINIFFWRLEIASGIELWAMFLLWIVEDGTFMRNWSIQIQKKKM